MTPMYNATDHDRPGQGMSRNGSHLHQQQVIYLTLQTALDFDAGINQQLRQKLSEDEFYTLIRRNVLWIKNTRSTLPTAAGADPLRQCCEVTCAEKGHCTCRS